MFKLPHKSELDKWLKKTEGWMEIVQTSLCVAFERDNTSGCLLGCNANTAKSIIWWSRHNCYSFASIHHYRGFQIKQLQCDNHFYTYSPIFRLDVSLQHPREKNIFEQMKLRWICTRMMGRRRKAAHNLKPTTFSAKLSRALHSANGQRQTAKVSDLISAPKSMLFTY